jgi:hypothetical protein
VVAPTTKAMASGPAFSWIQRQAPLYWFAVRGSEDPAMNPATQAKACSASTSPLRRSTCAASPIVTFALSPGSTSRVESGVESSAITHTASSSATLIARLPASQLRSTGPGSRFQA